MIYVEKRHTAIFWKSELSGFLQMIIKFDKQFMGPPGHVHGGYAGGSLCDELFGRCSVSFKHPIPLNKDLEIEKYQGKNILKGQNGILLEACEDPDAELFTTPVAPPTIDKAYLAGSKMPTIKSGDLHANCYCCDSQSSDRALGIAVGPYDSSAQGWFSGVWTPQSQFLGDLNHATIWAALDCPGWRVWQELENIGPCYLVHMTTQVDHMLEDGEPHIIMAGPLAGSTGRKRWSGVALFTADGLCVAKARQLWVIPQ